MTPVSTLPQNLITQYQDWRQNQFANSQEKFARLATEGQEPQAIVISCCDSRVLATTMFGADIGDFFMHRNIANLVPPYDTSGQHHGTASALEYAICALKVSSVIIMGHTKCGGVKGCHDMCSGKAPELEDNTSFVGRWIEILRPAYERVIAKGGSDADQVSALEREGIITSLDNLMSYPFVASRVEAGELAIHGAILDIHDGTIQQYNPATETFEML
ncbi:carbonic anhydrase [Amylibacter marinus]|uniref:Carbonic anhydrase n=1 Tax=Amylibacter marinus TaxID=1475483 RepID=A0ABQ5VW57_9RHOB|nr:carbonic anhydrase [Amylibacter marinus]GLQ35429.1 carbonic anhydrase [Amylibacter marinus]